MKAKRFFAVLLCMIMLITTCVPVRALADSETGGNIPSLEIAENENESNFPEDADEKGNKTETAESFHDENKSVENQMEAIVVVNATPSEAEPDQSAQDEVLESDADDPLTEIFEMQYPAFRSSQTMDDITVSVSADEGIFPKDSVLSVERIEVCPDKAVCGLRSSDTNVAASYTFDIKVVDPVTGEELQPAEGQEINVSFCMAEVADKNLDTKVYHIPDDGNAEALDVITRGETATAKTDGFSLYTVEFTYNSKQYVLPGDSEIPLSTVLDAVGLTGEVTEVHVSDDSLFSVSDETGEWVVKALSAFQSEEWMKVTIGGVEYEIKVTDTAAVCRNQTTNIEYETLEEAVNSASDGDTIIVLQDCTVSSAIDLNKSINIEGTTGNEVISRDTTVNTGRIFGSTNHASQITVSFKKIVLDGGAEWSLQGSDAASAKNRTDANTPATEALLVFSGNVSLELNEGTVIQNCNTYRAPSMDYVYSAGAIYCDAQANAADEKIQISLNHAVIKNCSVGGKVYSEAGGISCINYNNDNKIIFEMTDSVVTGCAALYNDDNTAGGLFLASCDTMIMNSQISGNYTYDFGGGLTQRWGVSKITDSEIKGNDAGVSGGGIALYTSADCTLNGNTVVSDNIAKQGGGFDVTSNKNALLSSSSKLTLTDNVKILRNKATGVGGGILFLNCSNASIGETVEITLNEAANGGGIFTTSYEGLEHLELKGAIYQNKAAKAGADLYAQSTSVEKISLPIASAMDKVYYGDSSSVPYRITDWYYDYSGDRFDPVSNVTATYPNDGLISDLALVAAGAKEYVFTVSFDANGHGTAPASQTVKIGNTATEPAAPTASGYTFGGWYIDKECTNAFAFTTPITENITLYAKWTEDSNPPTPPVPVNHTVSFNMNDHGTQVPYQTVADGNRATKPADPTESGWTFGGWYTDTALTTTYDFNVAVTADLTLYAKWTENSNPPTPPVPVNHTVSFNMNGHGTQVPYQSVKDGNKATKPTEPTASGYTFKDWYTDSTFQTAFDFGTAIHADTTLYAKWVTNSVTPADPTNPKTGDNSNLLLWVVLLAASGAAITETANYSRKRKKTN